MRVAVLCLLCATAACGAPLDLGFGVAVTATFDSTVSDAQLARVSQLIIAGSGDESYETDTILNRAAQRTESFVYRPLAETRRLTIKVSAEDDDGAAVAVGMSSELELVAGETTRLEITLLPVMAPDGGVPDGGAATCGASAFELCEDFENGLGSEWTTNHGNATVSIDSTYAHSGTHAMHVHLDSLNSGTSTYGSIEESKTFATVGDFHARAFVFFPTGTQKLSQTITLIAAQQLEAPMDTLELQLTGGAISLWDAFGTTTRFENTFQPFPIGSWACVEWIVHIGTPGSLSASLQDVPIPVEIEDTTTSTPPVSALLFGGSYSNAGAGSPTTPAFDFWMDDLVVDPGPIGCD